MSEPKRGRDPSVEYQVEQNVERIRELAQGLGYEPVETLEALRLTPEQTERLMPSRSAEASGIRYYQAARTDGELAKAILRAGASRYVAADVFSPGLSGGRASHDDF